MSRGTWIVVVLSLFADPLAFAGGPPRPPGWGEPKAGDLVSGKVKFKLGDRALELKVIDGTTARCW